jgi:hypothetical protein
LIPKVAAPGILGLRAACCRFSPVSLLAVVIWMLFAAAGCETKAAAGCQQSKGVIIHACRQEVPVPSAGVE